MPARLIRGKRVMNELQGIYGAGSEEGNRQ